MAGTMSGRLTKSLGTGLSKRDADLQSVTSFGDAVVTQTLQASGKVSWAATAQVDNDTYHKMLDEYRTAKAKQKDDELKIKQLATQLARTEEAAKRALIRSDTTAKGSTAQQLLDAQREVQQLRAENADLSSKLSREKKRCNDLKISADQWRKKAEGALREQRTLVRKLGEAERLSGGGAAMRASMKKAAAEQEFWSEEAGRRFADQQEELINLREKAAALEQQLNSSISPDAAQKYEAKIKELQHLVKFYEKRLQGGGSSTTTTAGLQGSPSRSDIHTVNLGSPRDHGGDSSSNRAPGWGTWVVEELAEGGASYLWDRSSSKVYSDAGPGQWPKPLGYKEANGPLKLGTKGRLDSYWSALSDLLHQHPQRLADTAAKLAAAGGGTLQQAQLGPLLSLLLPGAGPDDLADLVAVVTGGASQMMWSQQDITAALQDALRAREVARGGPDVVALEVLAPLRRAVRQDLRGAAAALQDVDESMAGALTPLEALQWLRTLVTDASASMGRQLLALLHEWDVAATGRYTQSDIAAALQLAHLARAPAGGSAAAAAAAVAAAIGNSRPTTPAVTGDSDGADERGGGGSSTTFAAGGGASRALSRMVSRAGRHSAVAAAAGGDRGGGSLQEQYLRDRVAALEAELASIKSSSKGVDAATLATVRRELAQYQARVQELESEFMSLDVMAHTDLSDYDAEMRKAWYTAAAFKKRYMEHKLELDAVKATAERMQGQLDETHKALQAEAGRRFAVEDASARWKAEAGRVKELTAQLTAERSERLKLEKEYLELQGKAFAAPGSALSEVRTLREELLRTRRDKALGEAKEADLRRELVSVKRQMEGVNPEGYRTMQHHLNDAERKLVNCQLELRAALDKLDVYRRTEGVGTGAVMGISSALLSPGQLIGPDVGSATAGAAVDEGKSVDELRAELRQLREVLQLETADATKLRQLLDTEASIALSAKAALEEAQRAAQQAAQRAAAELAALRRELDHKEERIRKLELQLKGAYGGLNKALRASTVAGSGLEVSQALASSTAVAVSRRDGPGGAAAAAAESLEEVLGSLESHENVIEFYVTDANLSESQLGGDEVTTFLSWDFYLHDSQATPLVTGSSPAYNTSVQYIVDMDTFLLEYLDSKQLVLDLCLARGWDYEVVGRALLPLKVLLEDLEVGAALGRNKAFHHADIKGPAGQLLGRVRYGYRVLKPLDGLMKQYKEGIKLAQQQQKEEAAAAGALGQGGAAAGQGAAAQPAASRLAALMAAGGGVAAAAAAAGSSAEEVLRQAAVQAEADPSTASQLRITIHRCTGLPLHPDPLLAASAQPYVHYTAPGQQVAHDTTRGSGAAPLYRDVADWGLVRGPAVDEALRNWQMQVAVFDDAASLDDPDAGLLGVAAVPCGALADSLPVEGTFLLVSPASGAAVGAVQLSMSWTSAWAPQLPHKPLPGDGGALQHQPASPMGMHSPQPPTPSYSSPPQQQQQQQQVPQNQQQQQQQQQFNLQQMQRQPSQQPPGGLPGAQLPGASLAGSAAPPGLKPIRAGSPLQVSPGAQPVAAAAAQLPERMLLAGGGPKSAAAAAGPSSNSAAAVAGGIGRSRYGQQQVDMSLDGPPAAAALRTEFSSSSARGMQAVLHTVPPSTDCWTDFDYRLYFRVDGLRLSAAALKEPALQHLLVAHMLLEAYTDAAEQCTVAVAKREGYIDFSYAVAYQVLDPSTGEPTEAGRALGLALAAAEAGGSGLGLPILLASSPTAVVLDFSTVECVGTCEIPLHAMWAGAMGDVLSRDFLVVPPPEQANAQSSESLGVVRLTLVACRVMAALKQALRSEGAI